MRAVSGYLLQSEQPPPVRREIIRRFRPVAACSAIKAADLKNGADRYGPGRRGHDARRQRSGHLCTSDVKALFPRAHPGQQALDIVP